LDTKSRPAFRGYPVATVAFYGPNDKLATKVVVSIILTEGHEPDFLERWFSEGDLDVRYDPAIGEQILTFLKDYAPRSTVVTDRIIGCPHEEGTDYPEGASCPQCPIGPDVTVSRKSVFSERTSQKHTAQNLTIPDECVVSAKAWFRQLPRCSFLSAMAAHETPQNGSGMQAAPTEARRPTFWARKSSTLDSYSGRVAP
jgi:hypothetical protein